MNTIGKQFYKKIKTIYNETTSEMTTTKTFEETFDTNKSRLQFLNTLLEKYNNEELSEKLKMVVDENIKYIHDFIVGNINESNLTIPFDIENDKFSDNYIPTDEEIMTLFNLININNETLNSLLVDTGISIKLPDHTIHQNITKEICIGKENIAHLLGITSSKSALKSIYEIEDKLNNPELYDEFGIPKRKEDNTSYRIVDYYTYGAGLDKLLKINAKIREDKEKNKHGYNEDGTIKDSYKEEFKKNIGYGYPIIEYNKLLAKNIALFNFMNLSSIKEIIVDNRSEKQEGINTECYLISYNIKSYIEDIKQYTSTVKTILTSMENQANDEDEYNYQSLNKLLEQLKNNYSRYFLEKFNIKNDELREALEELEQAIYYIENEKYKISAQVFGIEKPRNEQQELVDPITREQITEVKEPSLEKSINEKYIIKTNFSSNVPKLVEEIYKYSIRYFVDKITSGDEILSVSTPLDELAFHEITTNLNGNDTKTQEEIKELTKEFNSFVKNYQEYKKKKKSHGRTN